MNMGESEGQMTENIRDSLAILAALQQADAAIEEIGRQLAGVDERVAALDDQLVAFEQKLTDGLAQLETLKKQYRSDEDEVKTIENRIVKSEEKLRAVKTNKEYQGMLKEIDELKLKKAAIEDQMIEMLERIESAEAQAASLRADLADMRGEIGERQAEIQRQADEQRRDLETLNQKRDAIWADLEPKMQKIYTRARQQGRGVAVAAVIDAVCQACRMNLPPQRFIELLRMDTMQMCPHCQRIIYPKAEIDDL